MDIQLSTVTHEHLDRVRAFYEGAPPSPNRIARSYRRLLGHYYNFIVPPDATVLEVGCGRDICSPSYIADEWEHLYLAATD